MIDLASAVAFPRSSITSYDDWLKFSDHGWCAAWKSCWIRIASADCLDASGSNQQHLVNNVSRHNTFSESTIRVDEAPRLVQSDVRDCGLSDWDIAPKNVSGNLLLGFSSREPLKRARLASMLLMRNAREDFR